MENSARENSTEKLLDAIRGTEHKSPKITVSTNSQKISQLLNLKSIKKKTLNIGLFLSEKDICFVLTVEKGINKRKFLIKWATIKTPENLTINDDGFASFISLNLNEFTEGIKGIPIWCTIDSMHVKFRNCLIPDLSQVKIPNAALWSLKKEIDFDPRQEIFDFRVMGNIKSEGHKKKKIFALIANKDAVDKLKTIFSRTGCNLKGITSTPFAIQNYIHTNHLQINDSPFTVINLSKENSEMFCFSNSDILLARKIRSDLYNLVEDAANSSNQDVDQYFSSIKNFHEDAFFQIKQAYTRLIDKIMRTADYFSQNFTDNKQIKKYLIFGDTCNSKAFMDLAAQTIPVKVEKFEPVFDNLSGTIEVGLPQNESERNKVVLAFGIALSSDQYTPNFIHTYLDKLKIKKEKKLCLVTAIACVVLILTCAIISNWRQTSNLKETTKLNDLIQQKNTLYSDATPEATLKLISDAKVRINSMNQYVSAYLPLAVINEIFSLTPENIYFASFESDFDIPNKNPNKNRNNNKNKSKVLLANVIISGLVLSKGNNLESDLTHYILKLEESRFLGNINLLQKSILKNKTALNFKLVMDVF